MLGDSEEVTFLKTLTVLYVEDEPEARTLTSVFLGRRVGTLLAAGNGAEGLAVFQGKGARIVITDIRMPVMDGLDMVREIRQLDPTVLVIVTTAFEEREYLARAVTMGIDHYVLKPIPFERLEFALLTCAHRLLAAGAQVPAGSLATAERGRLGQLTERERQVLACVARGLPAQETGQALGISHKTVNTHIAHLMSKLGLHKSSALAAFAVRAGVV